MFTRKKENSFNEVSQIKGNWETIGLELLHQKYKHDFSFSEKCLIKNMLKECPPPLQYRRKVNIYI